MWVGTYRNDLVEVDHALVVLDLGDDLDVLALLSEDAADLRQRGAVADERREDHIHLQTYAQAHFKPARILLENS